jgi:hypothetical protein
MVGDAVLGKPGPNFLGALTEPTMPRRSVRDGGIALFSFQLNNA